MPPAAARSSIRAPNRAPLPAATSAAARSPARPAIARALRAPLASALAAALAGGVALGAAQAVASPLAGRWEGHAQIPGAPMALVLDIAPAAGAAAPARAWLSLPGRGTQGVLLHAVTLEGDRLSADASPAFARFGPQTPPPALTLTRGTDGRLQGQWQQAGLSAPLVLQRTGPAQPEPAFRSTPLGPALHGRWRGGYALNGLQREVTLTLAAERAELTIVRGADVPGLASRTTQMTLDRVSQGDPFLTLESGSSGFRIEGRWRTAGGEIEATLFQGPFEIPLVLKRELR